MTFYVVWNEAKTEGFATVDKQLAYEARKGATSNCYDQGGNPSLLAVKFIGLTQDDNCRIETVRSYTEIAAPYGEAIAMIREAIGELFGPVANLESEDAVLLRGPGPQHDAEAIIAALQRVADSRVAPEALAAVIAAAGGKVLVPRHAMENLPREIVIYEDHEKNGIVYSVKRLDD